MARRGAALAGVLDMYAVSKTPIGPLRIAYSEDGVTMVTRGIDSAVLEADYLYRYGRALRYEAVTPTWISEDIKREMRGERVDWRFDLHHLTDFERAVLLKTCAIPRGEVRSYSWIAQEIGHSKALRAVGTALANNPIPVLIPCHRVVRASGELGNYSGGDGATTKRELLAFEGCDIDVRETQSRVRQRGA